MSRGAGGRIALIRYALPRHKAANWVGPGRGLKSTRPGVAARASPLPVQRWLDAGGDRGAVGEGPPEKLGRPGEHRLRIGHERGEVDLEQFHPVALGEHLPDLAAAMLLGLNQVVFLPAGLLALPGQHRPLRIEYLTRSRSSFLMGITGGHMLSQE